MVDISIIVAVYNHGPYIETAIRSILMQKTDFTYEVLIGEDCSTDNSRNVLQTLEQETPDNFHYYYREKNLGVVENFTDLYSRMKGRYFIVLEGDDYWTDPRKLQVQYDFLETHPEYIAVAHNCEVVNINGEPIKYDYPECKDEEYTLKHFLKGILPGQTTTKLMRNYYLQNLIPGKDFDVGNYPGDQKNAFLLSVNGKVFCMQRKMSAYRLVVKGGSNYESIHRYDREEELYFWFQLYKYCLNYEFGACISSEIGARLFYNLLRNKCKIPAFTSKEEIQQMYQKLPQKYRIIKMITLEVIGYPFRIMHRFKVMEQKKNAF